MEDKQLRFKKSIASLMLGAVLLSAVPSTEIKAANVEFKEQESNDTAQTANEIHLGTGTTVIKGDLRDSDSGIFEGDKDKFIADEYDWYKIQFNEQGKCDIKYNCLTDPTENSWLTSNKFDIYDEDFKELEFKYGLAHDANDIIYIRAESTTVGSYDEGCFFEYEITLSDENNVDYVSNKHNSTSKAYLLTEGNAAFALGDEDKRYFAVEVPKGKEAKITITPIADADMAEINSNNYRVYIIRNSDNNTMIYDYRLKQSTTFNKSDTQYSKDEKFKGKDTYYISVDGGMWGNNQWYSVSYTLTDSKKSDTKKPTVTGIKNGKTYKKAVTIKYKDESGIKSAKLNGKKIKSGAKVTKKGSYTFTVTDKAGNNKVVRFKIK